MSKELNKDEIDSWSEDDVQYAHDRGLISIEEANAQLESVGSDIRYGEGVGPNARPGVAAGEPRESLGQFAGSGADTSAYDEWSKAELQEKLEEQGIDYLQGDTKAELVQRLVSAPEA